MPTYQDWLVKRKGKLPDWKTGSKQLMTTENREEEDDRLSVVSGSVYSTGGSRILELVTRVSKLEDTVIALAEQLQLMSTTLERVITILDQPNNRQRVQSAELDSSPILEK